MLFHFKDIVKVIRSAGETLEELSKEAPSEDRINATATKFLKSLEVYCTTSIGESLYKLNYLLFYFHLQ